MSHFTVTVKLSKETIKFHGSVEDAVAAKMAPYKERIDTPEKSEYMKFEDTTDAYRLKHETESADRVLLENGELVTLWDDRFRVVGRIGYGSGTHEVPEHLKIVAIPFKQLYRSFEVFMLEYCEQKPNEKGRCGFWYNPNSKWDYYQIGGRWQGFYPVLKGIQPVRGPAHKRFEDEPAIDKAKADIVCVEDLDLEAVAADQFEEIEHFIQNYNRLRAGSLSEVFDETEGAASEMGLVERYDGEVAPSTVKPTDAVFYKNNKVLVAHKVPEDFAARYSTSFCPIATYAILDENGWHSPGDDGWFGVSNAEAEDLALFREGFLKTFILSANPTDTLVLVDCHI